MNHDYLLSKIHCPSSLKRDLKQWLKAGVLDNGVFEDTEARTPLGGVISPILANIALDGMSRGREWSRLHPLPFRTVR
ncbi:MAG: hypothetical protein P5680_26555, partial [Limnospira sp. PMC 737.11]|nr:hypothetical protein [Limnospira sp. PMC 737.11]